MKRAILPFDAKRNSATIGVLLLLTGCTTLYDGKYDFREGWREARVLQIAPASEIQRPNFFDCIRKATPQQRESQTFAVLSYKRSSRVAMRAVPLPPTARLRVGDTVYLNISSCEAPASSLLLPRAKGPSEFGSGTQNRVFLGSIDASAPTCELALSPPRLRLE